MTEYVPRIADIIMDDLEDKEGGAPINGNWYNTTIDILKKEKKE